MVRAVASRVIPRTRISKAMARETNAEAARMEDLALSADAPCTIERIPTRASAIGKVSTSASSIARAKVVLRPMGNSRRMFLLDPYLGGTEMEGLAYRIRAMSRNEGINSLLIATDDQDDIAGNNNCLPRYITKRKEANFDGIGLDRDPAPHHTWHVAGGYDPIQIAEKSASNDSEYIDYVLESLRKLALAVQGDDSDTKVPIISLPHGAITDGGYALCMGSFVLATQETSFRILNPSRGLSLDPIGFSYILPRLGWDHQQASANYAGCGMILALSGYEANHFDMVQTGLATHLASDSGILPILEEELATMLPWNQQGLTRQPKRFYGQLNGTVRDVNAQIRNKQLAYTIDQLSDLSADASNEFPFDYTAIYDGSDASLDTDDVPWDAGFFSSPLVDMAAKFDKLFREEDSLEGLIARLKEAAAGNDENTTSHEHQFSMLTSTPSAAQFLVDRMQAQSPLALRVVHQLMKMGSGRLATMENCMAREAKAQRKLMGQRDFLNWAASVRKNGGDEGNCRAFGGWQHPDVKSVLAEEVDAILS